ncbi:hypothetical protein E2C01_039057 [Portunus trituberculatus]|uniref:Uncharacterized protein n=1 Tax=Portunus trituberculatus TaxID=210409 RepID=A0A5B7FJL9_PORTR|nr:hypothetical protein [Portunus trituberculatus]
MVPLYHGGDS